LTELAIVFSINIRAMKKINLKKPARYLPVVLFAVLYLCGSLPAWGQNDCYEDLGEASGFDVSPWQASLAAKACELKAAFPDTAHANNFRVFGVGFYMMLDYYDSYGYPQAFEDIREQAAGLSPYYLLIGRQSDPGGVFTRFWVDVKLPETGIFTCLTATTRSLIYERIRFAIEEKYSQLGRFSNQYSEAVYAGMKELQIVINNIASGICCESDPEKIHNVLINLGFAGFPCKILSESAVRPSDITAGRSTGDVLDFASLDVEEAGSPTDLNSSLSQIISWLVNDGQNAKGYITKNENFCDSTKVELVRVEYSVSLTDFDIWFHVWKNPDNSGNDILFVKSEKLDEIAAYFQSPPTGYWYPLTKSILVTHVITKCPPTIEINNFVGKNVFEETWHFFANTNFSPSFFYSINQGGTFSGGCRNSSPDGFATSYNPVSQVAFPNASWYEAKASSCDVYLSSYENQIRAHIQNLQVAQPIACTNRAAWFNIITTAGVEVSSAVYRYAGGFRIQVLHWEAWFQYNSNNKMEVKFGIKTALNRLAPSLFPPDFQSYNGYQSVLLQNCD
jgi:hypothetical protein